MKQKIHVSLHDSSIDLFIDKCEIDIKAYITNIDNAHMYPIVHPPSSLKMIKKNEDMKAIIYDVRYMKIYDKTSFFMLITYMEYFLRYHYHIMMGQFDCYYHLPILKDIRKEILNYSKAFTYNSPRYSPLILLSPDLERILNVNHAKLQSITYRYIKVLKNKYKIIDIDTNEYNNIDKHSVF